MPGRQAVGHVASHDERQLVLWTGLMQPSEGIDREGPTRRGGLQARGREARIVLHRQLAEPHAMLDARVLLDLLVRRPVDRHEHDTVQLELGVRLLRTHEVAEVRRVERASEEAELQGRLPAYPRT